ncbi:ABC transporter substrate-binding protein [Lentzea guizhouensis]|nr:ABC transporter substrate-binding protein [Lentzea guizhouensis]
MQHPRIALAMALVLTIAGCGNESSSSSPRSSSAAPAEPCDGISIAINPWVGYEANAAVISYLAEHRLGCKVEKKEMDEQTAWQGLDNGEVDVVLENWGHEDLKQKYIEEKRTAVRVGPSGNKGVIGWYVPPWLKKELPDITNWQNLNKYADRFKTAKSGDKGQLLDGDPSFVTNDEALVKNLNLNYKVVYAESELNLIKAFRQAEEKKTPLIGYFFEPQWLHLDIELVKVDLPPNVAGCDVDPATVACDYPSYELDKIASKEFADRGGPAYRLVKNFQWSNDEQNTVASFIAKYKMSPDEAAKRWIEANPDRVEDWLSQDKP